MAQTTKAPPNATETSREILRYYELLEVELEKKGLEVPSIPLCPPGQLLLKLQGMLHELKSV